MKQLLIAIAFLSLTGLVQAGDPQPPPRVITCEVRLIELPRAQANRLITNTGCIVKAEVLQQLQDLVEKKKATILAQPRVATISGVQAQTKTVRELIYPGEFEAMNPTNGVIQCWPSSFRTRELGVILNVTPTVGDNGWISVALTPEISQESKAGLVQHEIQSPGGKVVVSAPDIYTWSLATSVVLKNGSTILLATFDPVRDGQYIAHDNVVLVLLTATVNSAE